MVSPYVLRGAIALALVPWPVDARATPQGLTSEPSITATRIEVGVDRPALPHVEPVVAVHPSDPGRIVVAAMAVEAPHDDEAFHDSWRVVVFASEDGGGAWSRRPLPATPDGPPIGDPGLAWAADGTLYLTALVHASGGGLGTWIWQSGDAGESWTAARIPADEQGSEDHPVLDLAATPGGAIAVFRTAGDGGISVSVRRPGEGVFTSTEPYRPDRSNNNLGDGLGLGGAGLLFTYYSMSGAMPTSLWAVRSSDGGETWQRSRVTDRHVPVGFPTLALDRSDGPQRGRVYAAFVEDEGNGRVMVAGSDDGGATWSAPTVVHRDRTPVLRARPAIAVSRDGIVAVSWTDGRDDEGRGAWCWDVYAAVSGDGGRTFAPEVRLTEAPTCSQTPGNGGAGYRWRWGGDYAGITSDGEGRFLVAWSDTRRGVFLPRLARLEVAPAR